MTTIKRRRRDEWNAQQMCVYIRNTRGKCKSNNASSLCFLFTTKEKEEERVPPQISEFFSLFFLILFLFPGLLKCGRLAHQNCFGFWFFFPKDAHTLITHAREHSHGVVSKHSSGQWQIAVAKGGGGGEGRRERDRDGQRGS